MPIEWKKVTWYSQLLAIVLFVGVFTLGFYLGERSAQVATSTQATSEAQVPANEKIIADVTYACADSKTVRAIYRNESVELLLSDGRHLALPHAISASGARYATQDESLVFWNKGTTAFITEGTTTTFADCSQMPPTPI